MSAVDVARYNWRADLQEYTGALLRQAGLDGMAETNEKSAADHRKYAELMSTLSDAKATFAASAKTEADLAAYRAAKSAVAAQRGALRETGTPRPGVVDNFSEPTAAELTGLGY